TPLPGRMDLLTVLTHEVGHVLGFRDTAGPGVMAESLTPGQRLLATATETGVAVGGTYAVAEAPSSIAAVSQVAAASNSTGLIGSAAEVQFFLLDEDEGSANVSSNLRQASDLTNFVSQFLPDSFGIVNGR